MSEPRSADPCVDDHLRHKGQKKYAYAVEGDNPTTGLKILGKA